MRLYRRCMRTRYLKGEGMNKFISFLKDEEGQTSTEYILLVVVVVLIVVKFKDVAVSRLEQITANVFDKIDGIAQEMK